MNRSLRIGLAENSSQQTSRAEANTARQQHTRPSAPTRHGRAFIRKEKRTPKIATRHGPTPSRQRKQAPPYHSNSGQETAPDHVPATHLLCTWRVQQDLQTICPLVFCSLVDDKYEPNYRRMRINMVEIPTVGSIPYICCSTRYCC